MLEMKEVGLQIEGVSQAVCRIDTHDQRAIVERRKFDAGGGGQAGLAHAVLAREHEDPHPPIVRAGGTTGFVQKELKK